MEPQDFLAVVLPPAGHGAYCAVELTKKRHVFRPSISDLLPFVQRWHKEGCDTYFALGTYDEELLCDTPVYEGREAENARSFSTLFIDMDGYDTPGEALAELNRLLEVTGLGKPWIVRSGGGLHAYWPFTTPIDRDTWKPLNTNLRRLCDQEKVKIDRGVMVNPAIVLRVPGTTNFKAKYVKPRPVRLMQQGDTFDAAVLAQTIVGKLREIQPELSLVKPANVIQLPGARPAPAASAVKLYEDHPSFFGKIVEVTQAGKGCSQLKRYLDSPTEDGLEPLWRALLTVAAPCADGGEQALWLSSLHPYDTERMHKKLAEVKGPWTCKAFNDTFGGCEGCPAKAANPKMTTPIMLGRMFAGSSEAKEIELPGNTVTEEEPEPSIGTVLRPECPSGFFYGSGGLYKMVQNTKVPDGEPFPVCFLKYDLWVSDVLNSGGAHYVRMIALRPEGPTTIQISQKAVSSKEKLDEALLNFNIVGEDQKLLHEYVRACMAQHSAERKALKVPDHFGWQADNSFVLGGMVYRKGKQPMTVPMPGMDNIVQATQSAGTLDGWRQTVDLFKRYECYDQLAVFLLGTASPLMRYTGLFGLTVHACSRETGTGKSKSLELASSVWGHPRQYMVNKGTSAVAMQQRLGLLFCHPLCCDEVTDNNRKDFEWLAQFVLSMTEGKGKERMESGSNKERINTTNWRTIALLSSNTHAVDWMTGVRKHSSEGEMRRLLEFQMDKKLAFAAEDVPLLRSLDENYGLAGPLIAQYLVDHEDELKALVEECERRVTERLRLEKDERFWAAGLGCALAMAVILKRAGIIALPMEKIMESCAKVVANMRAAMNLSVRSAEDVLSAFIGENYGKLVIIQRSNGSVLAALGGGESVDQSITRSSIAGRVEWEITPNYVDFYIEESVARQYCALSGWTYKTFVEQLAGMPGWIIKPRHKKDMTSNMHRHKAPPMRVNTLWVRQPVKGLDGEMGDAIKAAVASVATG